MVRIGSIAYATRQGLGHLAKSFYDAGVIDEVAVFRHSHYPTHMDWYPPGTLEIGHDRRKGKLDFAGQPGVDAFLKRVDVVVFWETPWDWEFPYYCKSLGVKTVLVPMHEWCPRKPLHWFDKVICPSPLDLDYFSAGSAFNKENNLSYPCVYIPVPVRTDLWQQRTRARRFLHNAGHIGHREHKGTRQLLEAVKHIKSDFRLTVRAQDYAGLRVILRDCREVQVDRRVTIDFQERPYEELWNDHDVYIAPEKFNGLSLPLQEARAAGLLVMTTDRYPHNTWLPRQPLIPVLRYERARVASSYLEFDEAIVDPKDVAAKIDEWFDRDISDYSHSGKTWAIANSWSVLKGPWREEIESA